MRIRHTSSIVVVLTVLLVLCVLRSFPGPAHGLEVIDQKQETGGYGVTLGFADHNGQEFLPTLTSLAAVEIYVHAYGGDCTMQARILEATSTYPPALDGTSLGSASATISGESEGWLRFGISPHITLTLGNKYAIEITYLSGSQLSWSYAESSPTSPYPSGYSITYGVPFPSGDMMFRTYAELSDPDLVLDPHGIDVNVGSTFTVNVWITNIPDGYQMVEFDFSVLWDPNYVQYLSRHVWAYDYEFDVTSDNDPIGGSYHLAANNYTRIVYWDANYIYVTLEFRCVAEGSSQIVATGADSVTLQLKGSSSQLTVPFEEDQITCNQRQRAPSNPYHYVGGELFSANKLAVLAPYLALISVVAVAAFLVKKKLT